MNKRDIDIEILRHEITSLKHLVNEIKKDFVKKESEAYVLSQTPTDEEQQLAALNKEIMRREGELKQLIAEAKLEEETRRAGEAPGLAEDDEAALPSSGTLVARQPVNVERILPPEPVEEAQEAAEAEIAVAEKPEKVVSPIFKKLAEPKLPELPSDDRARLQLQSPNRLFFYWSSRKNPYENLHRLFGERFGGYDLSVRLINLKDDSVRGIDRKSTRFPHAPLFRLILLGEPQKSVRKSAPPFWRAFWRLRPLGQADKSERRFGPRNRSEEHTFSPRASLSTYFIGRAAKIRTKICTAFLASVLAATTSRSG